MNDEIEDLLRESGLSDDARLRTYLAEVRGAATSVDPLPSAELSALLGRRGFRRRQVIVTALVVTATLGVGAGTAAASPAVRDAVGHAVTSVVGSVVPGGPPAPAAPAPSATRRPAPEASPLRTAGQERPGDPDPAPRETGHPEMKDGPGSGDGRGTGQKSGPGPTASPTGAGGGDEGWRR